MDQHHASIIWKHIPGCSALSPVGIVQGNRQGSQGKHDYNCIEGLRLELKLFRLCKLLGLLLSQGLLNARDLP